MHACNRSQSEPELATVYIPSAHRDFVAAAAVCLERVDAAGYRFAGIVRSWDDAVAMMRDGRADVTVVADWADLPPNRRPRVEVATAPIRNERCVVPAEVTKPAQLRRRRPRRIA